MTVYKLSAKGIKNNPFKLDNPETCRLILRDDNSAILYQNKKLIQSDLFYRKPDSYLKPTGEKIPRELYTDIYEMNHLLDHGLDMFGIDLIII